MPQNLGNCVICKNKPATQMTRIEADDSVSVVPLFFLTQVTSRTTYVNLPTCAEDGKKLGHAQTGRYVALVGVLVTALPCIVAPAFILGETPLGQPAGMVIGIIAMAAFFACLLWCITSLNAWNQYKRILRPWTGKLPR
jgi:hypothetical protein